MADDKTNGMVVICRHPGDYICGKYKASKIRNVHWGRVSGGVHRVQNGFSLYGYIPYEDAVDIVACSGRHDYGYNDAKICVTASGNKDNPKSRAAYYGLVEQADEKAGCGIAAVCSNGKPSCTKRIREILREKQEIYRADLRTMLCDEGYWRETVNEAINNLRYQEILELEGDYRSPRQIIRIK